MSINFSIERWVETKETYRKWWAGELNRPLVGYCLDEVDFGGPEPELSSQNFLPAYDFAVSAEEIVDRWDYDLSRRIYVGDMFPSAWPNFGAGVVAAFLGAELSYNSDGDTVWFHPNREYDITTTKFEYDGDNIWLSRIKDIYKAAVKKWDGRVQLGMTDLGGVMDILSVFFSSQELLLHLYDHPKHVERLVWNIHELWWKYYDELNEIIKPVNPGYTSWDGIFSEQPYYMIQSDFSYMIGPDMFKTFVLPELVASFEKLDNSFYHLDGTGQLPHLDMLLEIESLGGIQWVSGAGNSQQAKDWMDVYGKILKSGKKVQLLTGESMQQLDEYETKQPQLLCYAFDKKNHELADAFLQ